MRAVLTTILSLHFTLGALAQAPENPPDAGDSPSTTETSPDARWRVRSGAERGWAVAAPGEGHQLISAAGLFTRGAAVRVRREPMGDGAPGAWVSARVVRVDTESGLALLAIDAEARAHSGTVTLAAAAAGMYARTTDEGAIETIITGVAESRLRLSVPCAAGAALVNETGDLLGICLGARRAAPSSGVERILGNVGDLEPPRAWRFSVHIEGFARMQQGLRATAGMNIGVRAVGFDRLGFELRAGLTGLARNEENTFGRGASGEITAEVQLHQAFRLGAARGRFVLGLGATYRTQQDLVSNTFVEVDPTCDLASGRCPGSVVREDVLTARHRFLPSLRLAIELETLALSYTAILDVENFANTTHSIGLGLNF